MTRLLLPESGWGCPAVLSFRERARGSRSPFPGSIIVVHSSHTVKRDGKNATVPSIHQITLVLFSLGLFYFRDFPPESHRRACRALLVSLVSRFPKSEKITPVIQAIALFLIFSGLCRQNKISTRRLFLPGEQPNNIANTTRFRQKRNRFTTLLKLHLQKIYEWGHVNWGVFFSWYMVVFLYWSYITDKRQVHTKQPST